MSHLVELLRTPTGAKPPTKWELQAADRIEVLEAALRDCVSQLEYFAEPDQPAILSALKKGRVALDKEC
jgi:hypothetical protein